MTESLLKPKTSSPQTVPFKSLDKNELQIITKYFEKKTFPPKTVIFNEGDDRHAFYIIEQGKIEKSRNIFGQKVHLITLGNMILWLKY